MSVQPVLVRILVLMWSFMMVDQRGLVCWGDFVEDRCGISLSSRLEIKCLWCSILDKWLLVDLKQNILFPLLHQHHRLQQKQNRKVSLELWYFEVTNPGFRQKCLHPFFMSPSHANNQLTLSKLFCVFQNSTFVDKSMVFSACFGAKFNWIQNIYFPLQDLACP